MSNGTLIGIKAKLKWADVHLDQLKADFFRSPKDPANRISFHVDEDGLHASIHAREPALEWGLMAGNVIHHVRASLDHLVYQLALQHPRKVAAYVRAGGERNLSRVLHFPIYEKQTDFNANWKVRDLKKILSKREFAAIESAQPYKGRKAPAREHFLFVLNALDNIDKHRTLLVIHQRANMQGGIEFEGVRKYIFQTGPQILKPGAKFLTVPPALLRPDLKVKVDKVTLLITFADTGGICDGKAIIDTLRHLRRDVEGFIDKKFSRYFQ